MSDDLSLNGMMSMWPKRLRAVAFRDAFAFGIILVISMTCVGLFVSWQTVRFLQEQIDTHLLTDARSIAAESGPLLLKRLSLALYSDPKGKRVGAVFDKDNRILGGNLVSVPPILPPPGAMGSIDDPKINPPPGTGHIRLGRISLPDGKTLLFGRRVEEIDHVGRIMARTLALAIVPIAILAMLGGMLIWRIRERRLRAVERACHKIIGGDFKMRLPTSQRIGEFRVISLTINQMLDEVERLMIELRSAGDAMAHDLRTPLTRLRARLSRIAEGDVGLPANKGAFASLTYEVDQLIGIIQAILRLGSIESGQRQAHFSALDVGLIVEAAADVFAPLAEDKRVSLECKIDPNLWVNGDRELLFEMVANLLDNAVKFTPEGGRVELRARRSANGVEVTITDSGPGIAAHERMAVLRRFHRGDLSRGVPGNGLGLSIVSAVAKLHASNLKLADAHWGKGCAASLTMLPCEKPSVRHATTEPALA